MNPIAPSPSAPIGVFDSGIGGLSVLRALQAEMPCERFVYLADSAHAPYGERGNAFVLARSQAIAAHLLQAHAIKALVVACNTATAAAVQALRARHPQLIVVGVEPALKPACALTRTGHVGVMATRGTLASGKFAQLLQRLHGQARITVQACDGLADALEHILAAGQTPAASTLEVLCARSTRAMGLFGIEADAIDTLVLGCTHYVFAHDVLQALVGPGVRLLDTGEPVARHTRHLLAQARRLAMPGQTSVLELRTTGDAALLQAASARWLAGPQALAKSIDIGIDSFGPLGRGLG